MTYLRKALENGAYKVAYGKCPCAALRDDPDLFPRRGQDVHRTLDLGGIVRCRDRGTQAGLSFGYGR